MDFLMFFLYISGASRKPLSIKPTGLSHQNSGNTYIASYKEETPALGDKSHEAYWDIAQRVALGSYRAQCHLPLRVLSKAPSVLATWSMPAVIREGSQGLRLLAVNGVSSCTARPMPVKLSV